MLQFIFHVKSLKPIKFTEHCYLSKQIQHLQFNLFGSYKHHIKESSYDSFFKSFHVHKFNNSSDALKKLKHNSRKE